MAQGDSPASAVFTVPLAIDPITGYPTTTQAGTGFQSVTTGVTTPTLVKGALASLYELTLSNPTAVAASVKLYNKAIAPTVGTDTPLATFTLAGGASLVTDFGRLGKVFPLGLAFATTALSAATDITPPVSGVQISGTYN